MIEREQPNPGVDNNGLISQPYILYDKMNEVGFTAGVTLKSDWSGPSDVYQYIDEAICGGRKRLVVPVQKHGALIAPVTSSDYNRTLEVDGAISSSDDLCLTVTTADCISMLAADPQSGYFGAIHIGWRCYIAGILDNFSLLIEELGIDLSQLRIALGPAIEACCFEVGKDVAALFEPQYIRLDNNRLFVDLRKAVRNKIVSIGVDIARIENLAECSSCLNDKYYSFRRDGKSPVQMVSFIYKSM